MDGLLGDQPLVTTTSTGMAAHHVSAPFNFLLDNHAEDFGILGPITQACPTCLEDFSARDLPQHCSSHIHSEGLECYFCCRAFSDTVSLLEHRRAQHGDRIMRCAECSVAFGSRDALLTHVQAHAMKRKRWSCDICLEEFASGGGSRHVERYHQNLTTRYECYFCCQGFSDQMDLLRHRAALHSDGKFRCSLCRKELANRGAYTLHLKSCKGVQELKGAPQQLSPGDTIVTAQAVSGRKRKSRSAWTCNVCLEEFAGGSQSRHLSRAHREITSPFECYYCLTGFQTQEDLVKHKLDYHKGSEAMFMCLRCDRSFVNRGALSFHTSVCGDRRPTERKKEWECCICLEFFSSASRRHEKRFHKGLTDPFECYFCRAPFKLAADLRAHKIAKHPDNAFVCPTCGSTFQSRGAFSTHQNACKGSKTRIPQE